MEIATAMFKQLGKNSIKPDHWKNVTVFEVPKGNTTFSQRIFATGRFFKLIIHDNWGATWGLGMNQVPPSAPTHPHTHSPHTLSTPSPRTPPLPPLPLLLSLSHPKLLTQNYSRKTTHPKPLIQNHSSKITHPKPLIQNHSPKTTHPG
jgi:hypothetical protein